MTAHGAPRPNIVVILCDDLGYGDVGVLFQNARRADPRGLPALHTPNLDAMAEQGLVLEGLYCPSPVCAPSRASLLTGTTQGNCDLRDNSFDRRLEDAPTLASVLRHAGYATACVGKWGLQGSAGPSEGGPDTWPAYPLRRGFDEFFGYVRHSDGHEHYPKEGLYRGAKQVWHNEREVSDSLDNCYTTDLFTAYAKHWITQQRQPFFLYLAYDTPHAVTELPTGPFPVGGLQWLGEPGRMINTAGGAPDSYVHPDYADATDGDGRPWPDVYRRYATAVRRIDDGVGDVLAQLTALGVAEQTLVLFTSDNGPSIESYLPEDLRADFFHSFGPFDGIKRDCWEGGVRVGGLVHAPGLIPPGRRSTAPVQFHDLLPTFAELAGVAAPARSDGVSLVGLLTDAEPSQSGTVYVEYEFSGAPTPDYDTFAAAHRGRVRGQMQMVRRGDNVGVRYDVQDATDPFEVYDVTADPQQVDDLAAARPDLEADLRRSASRLRLPHPDFPRPYDAVPAAALIEDEPRPVPALRALVGRPATPWVPAVPDDIAPCSDLPDDAAAVRRDGVLEVPAEGVYRFSVADDVRAVLRVHGATVIDADGENRRHEGAIRLAAGAHPYRLTVAGPTDPHVEWRDIAVSGD